MKKRVFSLFLALILVLGILPVPNASAAATYSVDAAIKYAKAHWNDGKGQCAEFVSRCVIAGGLKIDVYAGTGNCRRSIEKASGLKMQPVKLNSDGYATKALNGDHIAPGDVMVQWCYTHNIAPHILLCGGYNSNGIATFYAHNGALNNKKYNLGVNTSEEHTTKCNMGAQVIRLSTLDPAKSTPSATFTNTAKPASYGVALTTSVGYTGPSAPTAYGLLFGSSPENLYEWESGPLSSPKNPFELSFNIGYLEHNTTYYYQFYVIIGGKTYKDSLRSFTTTQDTKPISVASSIKCGYNVTIPAHTDVFFYGSSTSKEVRVHQPGVDQPYTLFCTNRLFMSDSTVRYAHTDKLGVTMYFRANPTMTFETVHNYTAKTTPSTCTSKGYTTYTCPCGESYVDDYTPVSNHSWGSWSVTVKPTSTTEGQEIRRCTRCSKAETRTIGPTSPFVDVNSGAFYETPVNWAVKQNITTGMDATHFAPDKDCTRGQIVTFLWRANGKPQPRNTANPFVDVLPGSYCYDAVLWAVEQGITNGMDATHFAPDNTCTRGQAVTFLWRAKGQPDSTGKNIFIDVDSGAFYYKAVLWAVENKITNGTDATHFSPDKNCTRGQIVTFLYRSMN